MTVAAPRPTNIVVLTGAGISAESGIATFRGPGGLGEGHRVDDERRAALATVAPNAAHRALAALDAAWPGDLLLVTQNVDDLHERAGSHRLVHMHGELRSALCALCGVRSERSGALPPAAPCPNCGEDALRPDIVFFGEMPYQMGRIEAAIEACDLFVSIGTSGAVYPAAGFIRLASAVGAATLELNLDRSEGSGFFDESRLGPAGELVPAWVADVLAG